MLKKLRSYDAGGGLTLDRDDRILFIFKDGRWDLPKGFVDPGNSASETALLETSEETGLPLEKLRVITELIPTVHVSKFSKARSLKRTRWFLLHYSGSSSAFKPQREEGIERCAWISRWDLEGPLANCPPRIHYLIHFWLKVRKEIGY